MMKTKVKNLMYDTGTLNVSGKNNRAPPLPYVISLNENFIDGLIKDKWVDPELRTQEIIALYQGQAKQLQSDIVRSRNNIEKKYYAFTWVYRYLNFLEDLNE